MSDKVPDIAVLLCDCGKTLSDRIDFDRLQEELKQLPEVAAVKVTSKFCQLNDCNKQVESVIKKKLAKTNNVIQKLFNHFNKLNGINIQVPYWTFLNKNNEFVCTMLNNENNYNFIESTNILINELQLALSHTTYSVLWQSNEILIKKTR